MFDPRLVERDARKRVLEGSKVLPQTQPPAAAPKPQAMGGPAPNAPGAGGSPSRPIGGVAAPPVTNVGQGNVGRVPSAAPPPAPPKTSKPPPFGNQGSGAPAAQPPPAADPAPVTQEDIDRMIREQVARELGGDSVDLAEDEALIQQRMDEAIGAGAVNSRARAGRAGFASSGALMAQEGDLERQARMAASEQALGLRRDARDEQFGRGQAAIGNELDMRRAAADDEINKRLLEMLGMDGPTAGVGNTPDGRTRIEPADLDGDGVVSNQEREQYERETVDPYMAGSQAVVDFRNAGGDVSELPIQAVGGDVIQLRAPAVDSEGNETSGVSYNTKTGQLGRIR